MARLGLHSLAITPLWTPADAERLLPPLTQHGVSMLEIPLLDLSGFDAVGTRRAVERHNMEPICSLGLPDSLDVMSQGDVAADYLAKALQVAREAGAEALSGVTYGSIGKRSGAPRTEAEIDAICRLIDKTARAARALSMRVGIEPCNRYETHLLNTAKQSAALIERIGAENVFIHMDTYHMNIEEVSMAAGFADAGDHLGYVHLSESNRGVPGQGTIDWVGTFEGLKSVGYDGVMSLESFVYLAPEIASGLAVWRPVAERPEDVIEIGLPFLRDQAHAAGIALS